MFQENEFDYISSICNEADSDIDENNDLSDYLESKDSFISKTVLVLKTQFIADTGDDLPELRLTSIPNTSQQLPELGNVFEQSINAISISPVNYHSPHCCTNCSHLEMEPQYLTNSDV